MRQPARHPAGAIVLADGEVPARTVLDAAWPDWADGVELVVAADGGARHAEGLGFPIDTWIGDGDSVDPELLARLEADGVDVRRVPTDKDETDTELAIRVALDAGAQRVVLLGALGGPRLDHALANLGLLDQPALRGGRGVAFDGRATRLSVIEGPVTADLAGRVGDLVSLLPIGGPARGVTTSNLRYPLAGEDLEVGRTRGVSNVRTAPSSTVQLESGRLLVIETPVIVGA